MKFQPGTSGKHETTLSKKEYLTAIKQRLQDDVWPYLDWCKEAEGKGFWGMIRLLMPVVEAVGYVQYKGLGKGRKYASKVLADLNVPFPHLSWQLFRNCLLHGDEILPLVNQEQKKHAGWRLSWGDKHSATDEEIAIDVEQLYHDLYEYIEKLIADSNPEDTVTLQATHLSNELLAEDDILREEYERLFSKIG